MLFQRHGWDAAHCQLQLVPHPIPLLCATRPETIDASHEGQCRDVSNLRPPHFGAPGAAVEIPG